MKNLFRVVFTLFFAMGGIASWADSLQIKEMFRQILSHSDRGALPQPQEFFLAVNENTVGPLSSGEIVALLPLARQCLKSARLEVRQDGLMLMMAVALRPDGSTLLEPYIDDLGTLARGEDGNRPLRHGALYILGSTKPALLPKAINYLKANLDNVDNSTQETQTTAISLLEAAPTDSATIHKVLAVVRGKADAGLTNAVMRGLGLLKIRNPEALDFLGDGLDNPNPHTREAEVDAIARLDSDLKTRFVPQLTRMAADSQETERIRSLAALALHK